MNEKSGSIGRNAIKKLSIRARDSRAPTSLGCRPNRSKHEDRPRYSKSEDAGMEGGVRQGIKARAFFIVCVIPCCRKMMSILKKEGENRKAVRPREKNQHY